MSTYREDLHLGHKVTLVETDDIVNGAVTPEKLSRRVWDGLVMGLIKNTGATAIGPDGYWYVDGVKTDIKAQGEAGLPGKDGIDGLPGMDADVWTIGEDGFWYLNGEKTAYESKGKDGDSPMLRVSADGMSLEVSNDGGQTWIPFQKDFNKLRVIGYLDSTAKLPKNAVIGDIYGVWNADAENRVDGSNGAYELYINTVLDWVLDFEITKVYSYDTELPSSATDGTAVVVPVSDLTLYKEKVDGYKVYKYSAANNGWTLVLNTAEIYAGNEDIVNYGDNVYALVQGAEPNAYQLYKRQVGWVKFGTNASIAYKLVQDVNEGSEDNVVSGASVKKALKPGGGFVDDEPTLGSTNLVTSGGVAKYLPYEVVSIVQNPDKTENKGYNVSGGTFDSSQYCYTQPIALKPYETIYMNMGNPAYCGAEVAVIYMAEENGDFIKSLYSGRGENIVLYTNTSNKTIYVCLCGYKTQVGYKITKTLQSASIKDILFGWIIGETFFPSNVTYTDGIINTPVSVSWPDGKTGSIDITRDEQGFVINVIAVYGDENYTLNITRDENGLINNITIN